MSKHALALVVALSSFVHTSAHSSPPVCSDIAGAPIAAYPCLCGTSSASTMQCTSGNTCVASSDTDGVCLNATVRSAIVLGTAGDYTILIKAGVSTTGATSVTGNIGVSPAAATYITGFGLIADSTNEFSTSSLVVGGGQIYAANYHTPTPASMSTAISDMETAYTAAAGANGAPTAIGLVRGDINVLTLLGGLYIWSTSVSIHTSLTFDARNITTTVWIMQIAGNLELGAGASVTLTNKAQTMNIFWQVAGSTKILASAHAEGIILCATPIIFDYGASLTGRALSQTVVTMIATTVTPPIIRRHRLLSPSPTIV